MFRVLGRNIKRTVVNNITVSDIAHVDVRWSIINLNQNYENKITQRSCKLIDKC